MFAPAYPTAVFTILVWDLTMNYGNGFRTASSIVIQTIRQFGLV